MSGPLVLVVDDEAPILPVLARILTSNGYRVEVASSAEEAIRWIEDTDELPGLALLDYWLGDGTMDGIGLARWMRADSRLREIPIVMMTAADMPEGFKEAELTVSKPFEVDELLRTIGDLVRPVVREARGK